MKRSRFLLILDTLLFVALIVLMAPRTSLPVHEWLGLAIIPAIVLHLVLAWQWIATTLTRLRAKGAWRLRINALLNSLLFVAFTVTVFTGAMTSLIALPALGIPPGNFEGWLRLHNEWQNYLLIILALHIAMNWNWILGAVRRHVLARPSPRGDAALTALAKESP